MFRKASYYQAQQMEATRMFGWLFYQSWSWSYQASQDAADAKSSARSAEMKTHSMESTVRYLEHQVERLSLALMAVAEVLRDRGIPEAEIEAKVREIDLRDGQLDGRVTPTM